MKSRQNSNTEKCCKETMLALFLLHSATLDFHCISAVWRISCRIDNGPSVLSTEFCKQYSDCLCRRSRAWKAMLIPRLVVLSKFASTASFVCYFITEKYFLVQIRIPILSGVRFWVSQNLMRLEHYTLSSIFIINCKGDFENRVKLY